MEKNPKLLQWIDRLFLISILFIILLLGFIACHPYENAGFNREQWYLLNEGWFVIEENNQERKIQLPAKLPTDEKRRTKITCILPEQLKQGGVLCFFTAYQHVEVYLEQDLIYSFGNIEKIPFGKTSGECWNMIRVKPEDVGKRLTLIIKSDYKEYAGVINQIYGGTKAAVLYYLIQQNGLRFVLAIIVAAVGITILILYLVSKKIFYHRKAYYLAFFFILGGLWLIGESGVSQFFIGNQFLILVLKVNSLLLLPIPFLCYITEWENIHYKEWIHRFSLLFFLNFFLVWILQLTGIADFFETKITEHLLFFATDILLLYIIFKEWFIYKNKKIWMSFLATACMIIFTLFDIIWYYSTKNFNSILFSEIGILIMIFLLAADILIQAIHIVKNNESAEFFETMAMTDMMVHCKNRTAFNMEIERINQKLVPELKIGIILMDVNNLKYINDTFGHQIGDDAIIRCGNCIKEILEILGECYRIGGDEFTCIIFNKEEEQIKEAVERFIVRCREENETCFYHFEVAAGYAMYEYEKDTNISEVIKRADSNMYLMKGIMKENARI